ncbi:MAG TPA: YEATS-associated helix-containing protein [Bacteroidota bacterium]|nr:YEATS-associated helix-containing protein [Bacteroidota bacterium]
MEYSVIVHLSTIVAIMIAMGWFGGYLNYLHNFDTSDGEERNKVTKIKYILLGIGAAFLVPAFLQMISSDLATSTSPDDYLIFSGFCLIAAIFSRRFIHTIGDRILEAAKNAEKSAHESIQKSEDTQLELTSAKERIEDVKLAVDIKNIGISKSIQGDINQKQLLLDIANSYVERTSVPDYSERIKMKAELGRRMGEIIVRNNFSKDELLNENHSEGMLMAIAYSVQLQPSDDGLELLSKISKLTNQLYTRYSILLAYDTLARNGLIDNNQVSDIIAIISRFRIHADKALLRKIDDTISILNIIM